jgi:hypothetical protein
MSEVPQIAIIGGGAAGFFAAIHAAQHAPRAEVTIFEKTRQVLAKVRISGGGRCNLTHACFDPRLLIDSYPRGKRELRGPFHKWQPRDTIAWFEERGVTTKTESDGRMFPTTDDSRSVIDALSGAALEAGVRIRTQCGLETLEPEPDGSFQLGFSEGATLRAKRVLLAMGGLKAGKTTTLLESLGHTITPLAPSLFTFHLEDPRLADLAGLAAPRATVAFETFNLAQTGPVLITHWGLSGPAVLKLSAFAARELQACDYRAELTVNWLGRKPSEVEELFAQQRRDAGKRHVLAHPLEDLPRRLWQRLAETAGATPETTWGQLPKAVALNLLKDLTIGRYAISGKSMNKDEFVTCGGVALKEVDFRTMESRIVPGLHFAGETLDVDAITGGYNFQAAWTTGRLAGLAMAEAIIAG